MLAPLLVLAFAATPLDPSLRGSELVSTCQAAIRMQDDPNGPAEDVERGLMCMNYIQGFVYAGTLGKEFCAQDASNYTIARVYVAYMRRNPKLLDDPKGKGFLAAMVDAYPCSAK
jgi:hypothetical protein